LWSFLLTLNPDPDPPTKINADCGSMRSESTTLFSTHTYIC
jgi:hypothetical protein